MSAICGHPIRGPKRGRIYVYDQRPCRRPVAADGEKCWQHRPSRCQHRAATNHSDDIVEVRTGHPFPIILCGFHTQALNIGTLPDEVMEVARREHEEAQS